jgi:hypothetical protein
MVKNRGQRKPAISQLRKQFQLERPPLLSVGYPKEVAMRIHTLPTLAAMLLLAGTGMAAAQDVIVTPEEQTVIREYVVRERVEPIAPPPGVEITVGTTLPDTVEVYDLDAPDIANEYSYVVVEGRTVLVEPETRRIVQIIE